MATAQNEALAQRESSQLTATPWTYGRARLPPTLPVADQVQERENCLRLAETLASFLARLRESAETLDIAERQRIVRLLVRNVLVGDDEIIIRHSIPMARTPRARGQSPSASDGPVSHTGSCLLRTGSVGAHIGDFWKYRAWRAAGSPVRAALARFPGDVRQLFVAGT